MLLTGWTWREFIVSDGEEAPYRYLWDFGPGFRATTGVMAASAVALHAFHMHSKATKFCWRHRILETTGIAIRRNVVHPSY
ncbi:hypothetical protein SODALDRAFT_5400 [Sodiomyces alkalinus F11]|uniref:Uncharacterized protein n=1 Tax=Sodiomyces alkalinus (strain CBS 110278 / VKM F-3762 / F11) TaxID=1314773 RepID=A0A3N2Q5U5_SODAK|nr:hypothetical protein SODALDRAFT_5400 [Sodiomyces alkalinus F11]ROT42028.1 hypothetical protein SODALDRAFT_5400 [Sodiomyces alkalinus F11]